MELFTLDFESYWSDTVSLSKMSSIEYVMHEETDIISCSIKRGDNETEVVFGEKEVGAALRSLDLRRHAVLAHNMSGFDALILTMRYGIVPKMFMCTLAMARPIHGITTGLSLGKLVQHYGIGVKDNSALLNTKGKRLKNFTPAELEAMRQYNKDDTDQCFALFHKLRPHYTPSELLLIDMTIRMRACPKFELDFDLLHDTLGKVREQKMETLVELAGVMGHKVGRTDISEAVDTLRADLASSAKFAALLEKLGVEVPMKPSPSNPQRMTWALAKTDEAFIELQDHDDERVQMAARARLGVKSTLLETRIQKTSAAARAAGERLPIPLKYCGAITTGRWSGEEYNPQNFPRINKKKPQLSDALRRSLCAPEDHVVVVADQSGIELRVNHFLWQMPSTMELYCADPKADLYRASGALLYECKPEELSDERRHIEKIKQLGLGFGAAGTAFRKVAKILGGLDITLDQADDWVYSWRQKHKPIVDGWQTCHEALDIIKHGGSETVDPWGLVRTCSEGLVLPSGRLIRYPNLHQELDKEKGRMEWWYGEGRHRARIYAGKVDENCLAEGTLVLTDAGWKRIEKVLPTDSVHDGVQFVRHGGVVCKSVQDCVSVDGVYMTPDHEVLTNEGWQAASQNPKPYRPSFRDVGCPAPRAQRRAEALLEIPLRLWGAVRKGWQRCRKGSETLRDAELRVRIEAAARSEAHHARDVQAPSVRGLAIDAGSLHTAVASGVEKLRRAWHRRMCTLETIVLKLLGRHGGHVLQGVRSGSSKQRRSVFPGELSLDYSKDKHNEQAQLVARGRHHGTVEADGHQQVDALLSGETRAAACFVYDILNCGPRHRFVVLGDTGPFIVHNCVQALARDTVAGVMVAMYLKYGLTPVLMVHDELVYIVRKEIASQTLHNLQALMRTPPTWWPELVTWSEGGIGQTYAEAK